MWDRQGMDGKSLRENTWGKRDSNYVDLIRFLLKVGRSSDITWEMVEDKEADQM